MPISFVKSHLIYSMEKLDAMFLLASLAAEKMDSTKDKNACSEIIHNVLHQYLYSLDTHTPQEQNSLIPLSLRSLSLPVYPSLQLGCLFRAQVIGLRSRMVESVKKKQRNLVRPIAIARILQGMNSACFPAKKWKEDSLWGKFDVVDFKLLLNAIEEVLR